MVAISPAFLRTSVTTPSIGERALASLSARRVWASATFACSTPTDAVSNCALMRSYTACSVAFCCRRRCMRSCSTLAADSPTSALRSWAWDCSTARRSESVRMRNSTWPFLTGSPSSTSTDAMMADMSGDTSARSSG